jgi:predicted amidophosphoribosyltransferase
MSKDNRKKGCPNSDCQMNIKKIRQSTENDFCPKCATRLVFVCSKCFDEIEDILR